MSWLAMEVQSAWGGGFNDVLDVDLQCFGSDRGVVAPLLDVLVE
jgi:hypothetical protein